MRTLAELIRWRAQRHPDLDAIWYEGKTQTYGELDRSSSALAGRMDEARSAVNDLRRLNPALRRFRTITESGQAVMRLNDSCLGIPVLVGGA